MKGPGRTYSCYTEIFNNRDLVACWALLAGKDIDKRERLTTKVKLPFFVRVKHRLRRRQKLWR